MNQEQIMVKMEVLEILDRELTEPMKKLAFASKCICDDGALNHVEGSPGRYKGEDVIWGLNSILDDVLMGYHRAVEAMDQIQ